MKAQDSTRSIRAVARDSFHYMVGLAVMGLANIILVPLYARYMSPAEFGAYALIEVAALALLLVCGLGYSISYLKWYAETERSEVPDLLGGVLAVSTLASIALGVVFWALVSTQRAESILETPTSSFAWVLLPLLLLESIQTIFQTHFRAERRPVAFSLCSLIRLVAITGFSVLFIVNYKLVLPGVFYGRVAGDVVGVAAMLIGARKSLRLRAAWRTVRPMLRYGVPLVISSLLAMVMDATGRYFLEHYGSLGDVGRYAVANKVAGIMRLAIVAPFGVAWGGLLFQIAARKDAERVFSKLASYVALLAASGAMIFAIASPILFRIFAPPEYAAGLSVVPLLMLAQAFTALQYPASAGLYLRSGTHWLVPVHIIALVGNLALNMLLVPRYGLAGTAWAWLGTWVILIGAMTVLSQRLYPIAFEPVPLVVALVVAAIVLAFPSQTAHEQRFIYDAVGGFAALAAIVYVVRDALARKEQFA